MSGNGYLGVLHIAAVDAQGRITGTMFGQQILGWWDEAAQKVVIMRMINPADPSTFQIYTGFYYKDNNTAFGGLAGGAIYTLAGYFEAFSGSGATASKSSYGWYAQIGIPT